MANRIMNVSGTFFKKDFGDNLHLQIIENISPKASVENSLAQWANFFIG